MLNKDRCEHCLLINYSILHLFSFCLILFLFVKSYFFYVQVSNLGEVKKLPEPASHYGLEGVVLNIKDSKGLEKWKPFSKKLEVWFHFALC